MSFNGRKLARNEQMDRRFMTKMAAMAINSKNFFFRTGRPMILKHGMKHLGMELYKVYVNHDPGMTLTYLTARSA